MTINLELIFRTASAGNAVADLMLPMLAHKSAITSNT
jgi:hypothetical protein